MHSQTIGHLPTGESVEAITLRNATGMELRFLTYGGIVTSLIVPDRDGHLDDVVLGFNDLESYLAGHPYFGAITGRVAGRISGGRFTLEGRHYQLALNQPPNHLHGGHTGLDKRLWQAESVGEESVKLTYLSPDGEEGYLGNVRFTVTYTLTGENEFFIETEAVADQVTPVSLTHHGYFNLAGEGTGPVGLYDHILQINADSYLPTDAEMTLLGKRMPVAGNDFRTPRRLGDALPDLALEHGDLYALAPGADFAARVSHPGTGRVLTVHSSDAFLQFYAGSHLDGTSIGKSGRPYIRHFAFCLECEGYPDALNSPEIDDILVRPGQPQRRRTVYAFSTSGKERGFPTPDRIPNPIEANRSSAAQTQTGVGKPPLLS